MKYACPRCPLVEDSPVRVLQQATAEACALRTKKGDTTTKDCHVKERQGQRTRVEVEHSNITSYVSMASPGCFIHFRIFPDDMFGLSWGKGMTITSPCNLSNASEAALLLKVRHAAAASVIDKKSLPTRSDMTSRANNASMPTT